VTSRLADAGAVRPSIVTEELIRLRLRHGNIAEQQASSREALDEMDCGMFATEGRVRMTSEPMTSAFREESDSTLVAATKNGESQAFECLVKRHETETFSIAFRITRNREDAQDVVQQSFLKAFMHLDSFQGKSSFSTWLTRIAINEGLMCLRRTRVRREVSLDDEKPESEDLFPPEVPDSAENPAEIYEQLENERIFCEAMNQLHAKLRTVICLQLEERTVRETAEILGLGIGALKARLFRARRKLRVLLARSPEFRGDRTMSKTRQRRDGGLNSHPPGVRTTSRGSRVAGSKARVAASVGWRQGTREQSSQSTESRMREVA
jgi:RNA polymerase sigma-70 factor (ECF subfamily)